MNPELELQAFKLINELLDTLERVIDESGLNEFDVRLEEYYAQRDYLESLGE